MLADTTVHIILTRFNVKTAGKESKIRLQPMWLEKRFDLFEKYCFPTVCAQSEKNFLWLIWFDVDTPDFYKKKIESYCALLPQMRAHYIDEWVTEGVHNAVRMLIPERAEKLLTTRLDNDDGLNSDFIKILQSQDFSRSDWYFNFPNGLTFSEGFAFVHEDRSNAFLSRLECVSGFKTVWELPHPEVEKTGRITQIDFPNAWLQVVHGDNVSNKIRGKIVSPEFWLPGFSTIQGLDLKRVSFWNRMMDSLFGVLFREGRDMGIRLLKRILRRK